MKSLLGEEVEKRFGKCWVYRKDMNFLKYYDYSLRMFNQRSRSTSSVLIIFNFFMESVFK